MLQVLFYCHLLSLLVEVSCDVDPNKVIEHQMHAQPCKRTKEVNGLWWAHTSQNDSCQWWGSVRCAVCGRPEYTYYDWDRYGWKWLPDQQPRCRHLYDMVGSDTDRQGTYAIARSVGGKEEFCYMRDGCKVKGTWTYGDERGCHQWMPCVNGYGVPRCYCRKHNAKFGNLYGQRCEHKKANDDLLTYAEGVQVFVNPLVRALDEVPILVSVDFDGTGFFVEISMESEEHVVYRWMNQPKYNRKEEFVALCERLTKLGSPCMFVNDVQSLYATTVKFPIIRNVWDVHFYRESAAKDINFPIGYERKIHVEAFNSPDHGKFMQDKKSAKKIFQTDIIVFVEYPVEIHCNLDVNIEKSCKSASWDVKPYIPSKRIKFHALVYDYYIKEFNVIYWKEEDKLRCLGTTHESTKWFLWKMLPNGDQQLVKEQKIHQEFVFNIEPYTLEKGVYKVEFIYSIFSNLDIRDNFAACVLNVFEVGLKVVIAGGYKRYVDVETAITIDASDSADMSFNDYRAKMGLKFEWGCFDTKDQVPCLVEKLAAVRKSPRQDVITLAPFTFKSGNVYNITLTLSKIGKESVQASQLLITGTGAVSSISMRCTNCYLHSQLGDVANPEEIIYLQMYVKFKPGYDRVELYEQFKWSYRTEDEETSKDASSIRVPGSNPYIFKIKENALEKNTTYYFVAQVQDMYEVETVFYTSSMEATVCDYEPKSGVRGMTLFNFTCTFESNFGDDYIFEFYDRAETDSDYFSGRMLGSGREFKEFRLTNGEFTVYTFTKTKMYQKLQMSIKLTPFNETKLYIRDRVDNFSKLLEQQMYGEMMTELTLLSDVLPSDENRKLEIAKLIYYLNQVRVYDTDDTKLCLSSLHYIIKSMRIDRNPLDFDPNLTNHISEILLRATEQLSKSLHYIDEEYTLLYSLMDNIYKAIVDLSESVLFQTRPSKPVELIDPKVVDTTQETTDNIIQVLNYLSNYLINRQIVDDDAKEITSRHLTAWVKVNTFDIWLNETRINNTPPIDLPAKSVNLTVDASQIIGIQITHMKKNPFWWSKTNIATEVLLLEVCNRVNESLCTDVHITKEPFHLEYDIEQSVSSLKLLEGSTGDVHPGLSAEDIDLAVTVYRFDPPLLSKLFIELICESSSSEELKVLIMRNLRPDYRMIQEDGIVMSCKTSNNLLAYTKHYQDEFFYMGIIPNEPKITTAKFEFKFLVFYTICYYWEVWQWSTFHCNVGMKTNKSMLQCDCTHLSTFAGSVGVPPTVLNRAEELSMLPIEETGWLLPLILLLVLLFMYLILFVWARWKDRKDLKAKDVIVLKDNYPGDKYAYLIGVFTGSRLNASCDANVGIKLFGEQNQSRAHILSSDDQKVFKGNSDNWFLLYSPQPLGILESLQLWHDNSGSSSDWFVETIVVVDLTEKIEYFFELNVWIALEVNEFPEVFVNPSSVQEYFSIKSVFVNNLVIGLRDTHYWTSILWKHPRNPVTRVQRLSVVMVFIMVALLTSLILFYNAYKVSELPEDIPSFEITGTDWLIFIFSSVVSSVSACVLMFIFRKSYSHDYKRRSRSSVFLRPSQLDSRVSYVPSITTLDPGRDFINISRSLWDDKFIRYGIRSQSKYERTTFQNFGVAFYSILRGSPLEQIKLPQYRSTLKVNRTVSIIAWILIAIIAITTIVTVFVLGIRLLPVIGEKWITIFVLTVVFDILVFSTLKILFFSILLSFMFLRFLPSPSYNVRPRDGMSRHLVGNEEHLHYLADIRSQPMYCPLSENMKRMYREERINRMKWTLLLDFVVLIICIVVLVMLNNNLMANQYFVNSHAETLVTQGHDVWYPNYDDVYDKTTMEHFLRYNLYPQLYRFLWYNLEDPLEPDFYNARRTSWTDDCMMKLLGNGRIRQLRVQLGTCSEVRYMKEERKYCAPRWTPGVDDQDVYSVGWKVATLSDVYRKSAAWRYTDPQDSGSHKITGASLSTYNEGGYIIEISYVKEVTLEAITELVTKNWLDHQTRAVFVEMTLINVNTGLLSQVILASEQMVTGQYIQKAQVDSFPIEMGLSVWNVVYVIFLIFFFLRMCILMNRKGILVYLSSAINIYEVFLLALGLVTVALYFVYTHFLSNYVKDFQRSGIDAFFSFSNMISYIYWEKALMSFLFAFLVVRSLISWRFGRNFYTFYYTFVLSLSWIVWLVLYFNILFVVAWRLIGYTLDVYIFPYYSTFLIYYNEYPYFVSSTKPYQIFVYVLCFLSYMNILAFVASFVYYYRVAKVHKLISTDTFNFWTFLYGKVQSKLNKK